MNQYIATVIDTTGIQPYIFGSNRLRENVGASYLVDYTTNALVKETLENDLGHQFYLSSKNIEDGKTSVELIYAGGGNAVLLFRDIQVSDTKNLAQYFIEVLSKKVLLEAPNLKLVVAHSEPFDWGNQLWKIIKELRSQELDSLKRKYNTSTPVLGLGVTATCNSTGLVAVDRSDRYGIPKNDSYLVSREIVEKLKVVDQKFGDIANQKLLEDIFSDFNLGDYQIPYDVDDMGRSEGENSYLAIVHADGNNMGDRFKKCGEKKLDREYIEDFRDLSHKVREAGIDALKFISKKLIEAINQDITGDFPTTERDRKKFLPFRPLVYGGDDVTFVCDGRLGLSLATLYLKKFQSHQDSEGNPLTACAGIAIVKTHYPFVRAYELSESLCQNAKKWMKKEKDRLEEDIFSALDWHIASTGILSSIDQIRKREYKVSEGTLSMRPIRLENSEESEDEWRDWQNLSKVIQKFKTDPDWEGRHNKIIALRETLRNGSSATQQFLSAYGLDSLPFLSDLHDDLQQSGWTDIPDLNRSDGGTRMCGYFDAIEAMDFYIPLGE